MTLEVWCLKDEALKFDFLKKEASNIQTFAKTHSDQSYIHFLSPSAPNEGNPLPPSNQNTHLNPSAMAYQNEGMSQHDNSLLPVFPNQNSAIHHKYQNHNLHSNQNQNQNQNQNLLKYKTDKYSIGVSQKLFDELKKNFRSFKHNQTNKKEKRIKKQLTLGEKTNHQLEVLRREMGLTSLNDCLAILIDFYNKNKPSSLKRDWMIKSLERQVEELNRDIQEQNLMISKNTSELFLKNIMEKKIAFLKDQLIEARTQNHIFKEYKKTPLSDEIEEIKSQLTESDFQDLKDKIKESIDADLSVINWTKPNSSTDPESK